MYAFIAQNKLSIYIDIWIKENVMSFRPYNVFKLIIFRGVEITI